MIMAEATMKDAKSLKKAAMKTSRATVLKLPEGICNIPGLQYLLLN